MSERFHVVTFRPGDRHSAICRDGRERSAIVTGWPDYSTARAAVQIRDKGRRFTVSGFITFGRSGLEFVGTGCHRQLIPLTGHRPRTAELARRLISATAWGFACPGVHWDLPSAHAAELAQGCFDHLIIGCPPPWTAGNPVAHEIFRKLARADIEQLARFYLKLEGFLLLADE